MAEGGGRASEHFRRVAEEMDRVLVRAVAHEREEICDAARISFSPYAPNAKGSAPPVVLSEGARAALGIIRS